MTASENTLVQFGAVASYTPVHIRIYDTASQKWGLKMFAPTSFSDGTTKSANITLTATVS